MAFKMKKATIYKLVDDSNNEDKLKTKKKSSKPNEKKDKKNRKMRPFSEIIEDKDVPVNKDGEREF